MSLSSPPGYSVNDAIPLDICHMRYASVADAARLIRQLGAGTLLAKVDLQNAYWLVPVHLDDHQLQGLSWDKEVYIDTVLSFGFRLAPKILSAVVDALPWILLAIGVNNQLHYLDDFLLLGPPGSA